MDNLVDNGFIKAKLFGIALSRHTDPVNDGVINFGGIDSGLFEGDLTFSPSVSQDGLWELAVDDAGVDGNAMLFSSRTAVIDSGTSLVCTIFFPGYLDLWLIGICLLAARSTCRCFGNSFPDPWR